MQNRKKWLFTGALLLLALLLKWFSGNAARVETAYATGFYAGFAKILRLLFGWLPVSLGDVLYGLAAIWALGKIYSGCRLLWQKKATWAGTGKRSLRLLTLLLLLYVVFNSFWGINYNRQGIAQQLGLQPDTVSYADLTKTTALLIQKLNAGKKYLLTNKVAYPANGVLFKRVQQAYAKAQQQYSFFDCTPTSLKASLWGWLGNYAGFTGYYNPFTGEAQVNTTVPAFLQPFVACHEVAHQLGYAKENEANSVGYLAALHSGDSLLLYSTYFDLYNYASRQLYTRAYIQNDTMLVKDFTNRLLPQVKNDLKEMATFFSRHRNPIEPFIRKGYALYLKNNNQPLGILSYDAVTSFLVAYHKKFGTI